MLEKRAALAEAPGPRLLLVECLNPRFQRAGVKTECGEEKWGMIRFADFIYAEKPFQQSETVY